MYDFGAHGMDRGDPNLPAFADPIYEQPLFGLYSVFRPQGGAIGAGGIGPRAANISARGMFEPSTYGPIPADGGIAWAGVTSMRKLKYRDVVDPVLPQYAYRQYEDDNIKITRAPNAASVGKLVTQAANNTVWNMIVSRIGDWPTYAKTHQKEIALAVLKGATAAAGSITGSTKGKKAKKRAKSAGVSESASETPSAPGGLMQYLPWLALGGGVLVIALFVMKKKVPAPTTANPRTRRRKAIHGAF